MTKKRKAAEIKLPGIGKGIFGFHDFRFYNFVLK